MDDASCPLRGLAACSTIDDRLVHGSEIAGACIPWKAGTPTVTVPLLPHTLRRWRNFGLSGAKLIWGGEAAAVQPDGRANPNQTLATPSNRAGLAALLEELRSAHRERIRLQRRSAGRTATDPLRPIQPAAMTSVWNRASPIIIRCWTPSSASTRETIRWSGRTAIWSGLIDRYVAAAGLARDVGFQFVDVKACHGYLLHEFLSARDRSGPIRRRFRRPDAAAGDDHRAASEPSCPTCWSACGSACSTCRRSRRAGRWGGRWISPSAAVPLGVRRTGRRSAGIRSRRAAAADRQAARLGCRGRELTCGSPYYNPHIQRPAMFPPSDGYLPPEDPLVGCRPADRRGAPVQAGVSRPAAWWERPTPICRTICRTSPRPWCATAGSTPWASAAWCCRIPSCRPTRLPDGRCSANASAALSAIARPAPRNGLVSGCFPLDPYYKDLPEAETLKAVKQQIKQG